MVDVPITLCVTFIWCIKFVLSACCVGLMFHQLSLMWGLVGGVLSLHCCGVWLVGFWVFITVVLPGTLMSLSQVQFWVFDFCLYREVLVVLVFWVFIAVGAWYINVSVSKYNLLSTSVLWGFGSVGWWVLWSLLPPKMWLFLSIIEIWMDETDFRA